MQNQNNRIVQSVMLSTIVLLLAVIAVLFLQILNGDSTQEWRDNRTVEKNENSISIPGFELLELKADTKKQTISLSNPPQNTCYFRITLRMEDGTVLWVSDYIKPGKKSKPITLETPLSAGTYSGAVLQYECFRMDKNRTPLNGAETKLTLLVK